MRPMMAQMSPLTRTRDARETASVVDMEVPNSYSIQAPGDARFRRKILFSIGAQRQATITIRIR